MSVGDYERKSSITVSPIRNGSGSVLILTQSEEIDREFPRDDLIDNEKYAEALKVARESQSIGPDCSESFISISEKSGESDSWHEQSLNRNQSSDQDSLSQDSEQKEQRSDGKAVAASRKNTIM